MEEDKNKQIEANVHNELQLYFKVGLMTQAEDHVTSPVEERKTVAHLIYTKQIKKKVTVREKEQKSN